MKRFGIDSSSAFGVGMPVLREMAKSYKNDHALALDLWQTGYHEARILASIIADPKVLTQSQMDDWVKDFYSWDLCDQVCGNLFARSSFAVEKIEEYSCNKEEFIKRAGFALIASYAVKGKTVPDEIFMSFLPIIEREAWDNRNYVKKAVNWALRQIGKKNINLCEAALSTAHRIKEQNTPSAKWIAADAIRELTKKQKSFNN